jgi:hypothetical protein
MNGDSRRTLHRLVMLGTIVLSAGGFARPIGLHAQDLPRVRSSSPVIRGMIADATDASPTFRALVSTIASTDGIIYIEEGVCGHGVRACLSMWVAQSAGFRFLRVLIDLRGALTGKSRDDLLGTIGHELWHALEVLADPKLTTTAAIFQFYAREAPTSSSAFETGGAVSAGARVRREVGNGIRLVTQNSWRYECAGPEGLAGSDGWRAWPCM